MYRMYRQYSKNFLRQHVIFMMPLFTGLFGFHPRANRVCRPSKAPPKKVFGYCLYIRYMPVS
jgi:hypothetical protein